MKTKCIESEQPPSSLFPADGYFGYLLDPTITKSNGKEFKLLGIREKNYKGSLFERLWLGISALCQAFFATATWRPISDTVREDLQTAWTGKRLTAIYYRALSIVPVKTSTDCEDLITSDPVIPSAPSDSGDCFNLKTDSNGAHLTDRVTVEMKNVDHKQPLVEMLPSPLPVVSILPTAKNDTSPSGSSDQILSRPKKEGSADPLLLSFLNMSPDDRMEVQFACLNKWEKAYAGNKSKAIKDKLQSCLDAILRHGNLHEFLSTHPAQREHFFTAMTAEGRLPIDWEKKDPTIQKVILNLFLTWAPDEPLAKFIGHEVCSQIEKDQFRYPSLVKRFFEELTDSQVERLAGLPILEPLLMAMCEIEHPRLLARLYATQPHARIWDDIRFAVSSYSTLICLLTNVWLLDTLALLGTASDADSLGENLKDLFNSFKMPQRDHDTVEDFAWRFLMAASSLNARQIQAVAYALGRAPLFQKHGYDEIFMEAMLSCTLSDLEEQGLSDPDAIIAPLLKEWVSIKACSTRDSQHDSLVFRNLNMKRKEHVKAFVEGVKDSPEPWHTLYLSLLIRNQDVALRHPVSTKVSTEEIMQVFSSFGFDYDNYSFLSRNAFFKVSFTSTRKYLEQLRDLDSEEKLVAFLALQKNRNECSLRALIGGIVFSKQYMLKPRVDELLIKNHLEMHGLVFQFFNRPIPIGEFLEASD